MDIETVIGIEIPGGAEVRRTGRGIQIERRETKRKRKKEQKKRKRKKKKEKTKQV